MLDRLSRFLNRAGDALHSLAFVVSSVAQPGELTADPLDVDPLDPPDEAVGGFSSPVVLSDEARRMVAEGGPPDRPKRQPVARPEPKPGSYEYRVKHGKAQ